MYEHRYLYRVIIPGIGMKKVYACDRNHAIELSIGNSTVSRKLIKTKRL